MFSIIGRNEDNLFEVKDSKDGVVEAFPREVFIVSRDLLNLNFVNYGIILKATDEIRQDIQKDIKEFEVTTNNIKDNENNEVVNEQNEEESSVQTTEDENSNLDKSKEDILVPINNEIVNDISEICNINEVTNNVNEVKYTNSQNRVIKDLFKKPNEISSLSNITNNNVIEEKVSEEYNTSLDNNNSYIEKLIRNTVQTNQKRIIELNNNDTLNNLSKGIMEDLYIVNTDKAILLLNLFKYNELDDIPDYSMGFIDKSTLMYREIYNSPLIMYCTRRNDYLLLIKRYPKITINKIRFDLDGLKKRIIGNPFKITNATIHYMPTNYESYYFLFIISKKFGCIAYILLIDMKLRGQYYVYKVDNTDVQNWLNNNIYYRKVFEDGTISYNECSEIEISNINVYESLDMQIRTNLTVDNKILEINFTNSVERTEARVIN